MLCRILRDEVDPDLPDKLRAHYKPTDTFGVLFRREDDSTSIRPTWGDVMSVVAPPSDHTPHARRLQAATLNYWVAWLHAEHGGIHDCGCVLEPQDAERTGRTCFISTHLWTAIEAATSTEGHAGADRLEVDLTKSPAVMRIVKRVDFMRDVTRAIFPVAVQGHWIVVAVDFPNDAARGSVEVHAAAQQRLLAPRVAATFHAWLRAMHGYRGPIDMPPEGRARFDPGLFDTRCHCPDRQQDDNDGGVFAIMAMAALASGDDPGLPDTDWSFSQQHVEPARAWMMQTMYLDCAAGGSCGHPGLCKFA